MDQSDINTPNIYAVDVVRAVQRTYLFRLSAEKVSISTSETTKDFKLRDGAQLRIVFFDDAERKPIGVLETTITGVAYDYEINGLDVFLKANRFGKYTIDALYYDPDYGSPDGAWRAELAWKASSEEVKNHAIRMIRAGHYENTRIISFCKTVTAQVIILN